MGGNIFDVSKCECARTFEMTLGRPNEYRRFKRLLDAGRHPTYVGQDTVRRSAVQGGLLFARRENQDIAVALVNPRLSILTVLNVHPAHRSHGLGSALLSFVRPNFARVIEGRVGWFEAQGYQSLGPPKPGRRYSTQVMVRSELRELAGRVNRVLSERCGCCAEDAGHTSPGNGRSEHLGIIHDPGDMTRDVPATRMRLQAVH